MYILSTDWDSSCNGNAVAEAHAKYNEYLLENKDAFPISAYEFATATWHHDFSHHKALHDSWLSDFAVMETGDVNSRTVSIQLVLFGAFHDGHLHIEYSNVTSYQIGSSASGHTSINRDEVRLSESGLVVHEIVWWQSTNWTIECADINVKWIPLANDV
ncbi:hypothetical protein [Alteromonas sp. BMJM2]|uniref:hypothetical protein n=1 Tax=Alteromonas sp. BMJM2 TaxID=2954241 RepID=UPI0022B34013|nr:hypothetical protein [Alteromonas sp. BMJM2]